MLIPRVAHWPLWFAPERLLPTRSHDCGQISDSHQVVSGGSEFEDPAHQPYSSVSGFAHQPHGLQPAKDFFYLFALSLTNLITRVASGPLVDRASSSLVVLGHMRRHLAGAQISDKVFRVVSFVTAHGDPFLLRPLCQHQQRRFSFRSAAGTSQQRIHHQAVAILHQHVALKREFRFAALGLLKQSEIRVGGRFMRFIRAFLPMEVHRRIARSSGLSSLPCFDSSLGRKLFRLAQPSTIVPSTVKCSSDNNSFSRAKSSTAAKNSSAISPRSKRSRFVLKVVAFQTSSSMFSPTNQRNNMLYCNCSISIRSLRTE